MSIKIAVGSSNGIDIDGHFGSGRKFYVFELSETGNSKFIEIREIQAEIMDFAPISCNDNGDVECVSSCNSGSHDESGLVRKISLLSDCQTVLVNQIGKGAENLLLQKGVSSFQVKGPIEKALSKLYSYYKRTNQLA